MRLGNSRIWESGSIPVLMADGGRGPAGYDNIFTADVEVVNIDSAKLASRIAMANHGDLNIVIGLELVSTIVFTFFLSLQCDSIFLIEDVASEDVARDEFEHEWQWHWSIRLWCTDTS